MTIVSHVETLRNKHSAIDNEIDTEFRRPLPDETRLHDLKRQKLKLKDEIQRLVS